MKRFFIPIRYKILVSLLFVITIVVGVITFTMANLFHTDKTAYINDLISTNTVHTAQEARALIRNYRDRIGTIARVAYNAGIGREEKSRMLEDLFEDFPEMIAIIFSEDGTETVSVYDEPALASAGISKADLDEYRIRNPVVSADFDLQRVLIRNTTLSDALPAMTMASKVALPGSEKELVVEALIRTDRLLSVVSRSELFEAFILEPGGSFLAHSDIRKVHTRETAKWTPDRKALPGAAGLAATFEYAVDGIEMMGGFTRLEMGDLIAGAQISKAAAYLSARDLFNNLFLISFAILLAAAAISLVWSHRLTRPLVSLTQAARDIGKGDFDIEVTLSSRDEIGSLTESVSTMAQELKDRDKALKEAQTALIQSEKMSAFGQLSAGIAHEVKNPLAGILGYTQLSLKQLDNQAVLEENLNIIQKETRRCNSIIENLMKFARQEKTNLKPLDIRQVVEDSVAIVAHQLGVSQVLLDVDLAEDLPSVRGDSNQLQQVLMNIMINAQQAMDGTPGTIELTARSPNAGIVEIVVSDNGPGLAAEVREKIFEPFFTTKEAGKGTGLGLAVTYGIIQDHGGNIRVESEPGEGATFIITLPVATGADQMGDTASAPADDSRGPEDAPPETSDAETGEG